MSDETVNADLKMPDVGAYERQKLARDAARAKAKQVEMLAVLRADAKKRAKSPKGVEAYVKPDCPREAEVARMFPGAIEEHADRRHPTKVTKAANITVLYDAPENHRQHVAEGWEPVIVDGEHHQERSDLCYTRPVEISRAKHHNSGLRARQNVASVGQELADADPNGDVLTENRTGHSLAGD